MEYLVKGELKDIKAGGCVVFCSSDDGCGQWGSCVFPTTYTGCAGGATLKLPI